MNAPLIAPTFDTALADHLARDIGGEVSIDGFGEQYMPLGSQPLAQSVRAGWVAPLTDLGVLRAEGEQAVQFLHSQFTNDLENLPEHHWQLTGYCSAKGRLLATLLAWRDTAQSVMLIAPQPLIAGLRKRLSMFILRAKVRITDDSGHWVVLGVGGERAARALAALPLDWPAIGAVSTGSAGHALGFAPVPVDPPTEPTAPAASTADVKSARCLLIMPRGDLSRVWPTLSQTLAPAPSFLWRWTEVRTGVPRIAAAGVEHFVPQMVNLDLVQGVSFRKGCYPGQEIVARSHYLGKLKRRMFLAHVTGEAPDAGTDVFAPGSAEPCGEVVTAALSPEGGAHVLYESQIVSAEQARLADGRPLAPVELPYALAL